MAGIIKLVRDFVLDHMRHDGKEPDFHVADEQEFKLALDAKLREECEEAIAAPHDPGELADVLEVIYTRARLIGITPEALEVLRLKKRFNKGGFEQRYIVKFP